MYMRYWTDGSMSGINAWTNVPLWIGPLFSIIVLVALWSLFWKGLALWHAGQRGQPWWFVIILLVNTLGVLELIYLFGVAKLKLHELFSSRHHSRG